MALTHKVNLQTKRTTGQNNQVIYDFKIIGYESVGTDIDMNNYRIVGCHNIPADSSDMVVSAGSYPANSNSNVSGSIKKHAPDFIHYNSVSRPPRRYDTFTNTEVRCKYNIEINLHLSASGGDGKITGYGGYFKDFGYKLHRNFKDFLDRDPNNNNPLEGQAALNAGYSHSTDGIYTDNDSFILEYYDSGVWKKVTETNSAGNTDTNTGKYPYDDIYENTPLASLQHSIGVDTTYDHKYIVVSGDTYIDKETPTTNYGTATTFGYRTGPHPGPTTRDKRGMFKFDITTNFGTEAIKHAEMWNFIKDDVTVGTNVTSLDCRQLSSNWSDTTATYTNTSANFPTSALDTIDYSGAGSAAKKTFSMFSLPTALIETWKVEANNYGVGTVLTDITNNSSTTYNTNLLDFTGNLELKPRLIVAFTDTASGEKIWHGYQSNLWSNGNNWSTSAAMPQPSETAIFDSTVSNNDCLLDVDTSINALSANTYTGTLNLSSYTLSVKTDAYLEHLTNLETSASTLKFTDTGVATLSSNTFYNLEFAGNTGLSGSNTSPLATEVSNNLTVGGTLNIGNNNLGSGVHDLKLLSGSTMSSSNGIITGDGRLYIVDDVLLDTTGTLSNYAIHYVSSAANVTVMSGDYSDVSIVQLINDDSSPHTFEFQGGIHKYKYLDAGLGNNTDVAGTNISLSVNSPSVSAYIMDLRNNSVTNHVQFFIGDTDFRCNSLFTNAGTKTISASGGRIILGGEDTFNSFQAPTSVIETDLVFEDGFYTPYGNTVPPQSNEAVIKANNITVSGSSTNTPILDFLYVDTLSAVNDIIVSGGSSTFTNLQGSKLAAGNNIKFIGQGNAVTTRLNMNPTSTWYQNAGNKMWAWYAAIQNAVASGGTSEPGGTVVVTSDVSTFAGDGSNSSTNGPGTSASFKSPKGIDFDSLGNMYVADDQNWEIRKITPAGDVTTFAGGTYGDVDGLGTSARFRNLWGLALDSSDNIYVVDWGNHKIRKITPAGEVSTFAGTGSAGSTDGTGTSASFNYPGDLAVDSSDNIYVADKVNNKIRKITPAGVVSTFAGTGTAGSDDTAVGVPATFNEPRGVAVDASDNVYVGDTLNNKIRKITPAGEVSTFAGDGSYGDTNGPGTSASFKSPRGIDFDSSGNMYVVDLGNYRIRRITPAGVVSSVAGDGSSGDRDGPGDNAEFFNARGIVVDSSDNIYVADTASHKIRKIVLTETINSYEDVSTFAGSGTQGDANGAAASATFYEPFGIDFDSSGNMYVADSLNNKIRKITPAGEVSTLAGSGSYGDANGAGNIASFKTPSGVVVDASGNVYVADTDGDKIRKVTPSGEVSTIAGTGSQGSNNGAAASATFYNPMGLVIDSSNNIYVADERNHKIRKITPAGDVSTFAGNQDFGGGYAEGVGTAARFNRPMGLAIDSSNNIYVGDSVNHRIRKITPARVVSTIAGTGSSGSIDGPALSATFHLPHGIVLDSSNNIYVVDVSGRKIRMITPSGTVITIAGDGNIASDDGAVDSASFTQPRDLAIDSSNNIYVADRDNDKIRKIQRFEDVGTMATSGNAAASDDLGGNTNWFFENDKNNLTDGAIVTVDQTTKISTSPITLSFTATDTQTGITSSDISIDLDPLIGAIVPGSFNYEVANELTFNVEISAVTPTATDIEVTTINGSQLTATDTFGPYNYNTAAGTISFQHSVPSYGIKNDEISVLIFADDALGFPLGGPTTVFYGEYNGQVVSFNNFYIENTTRAVAEAILPATTETLSGNLSISATNIEGTTFTGNSSAATNFNNPMGIAVDTLGNVYVADTWNYKILKITPAGVVSDFAGTGSSGDVDGAAATASFGEPSDVTFDSLGNMYVADMWHDKIRKITPSGIVSTVVSTVAGALAVDSLNNLYVVNRLNNKIHKITQAGVISNFAGTGSQGDTDGPALSATFYRPEGIAIDSSDNMYVADTQNNKIRKITPSGVVSTFAGAGGFDGDVDGAGNIATFGQPYGIAVDLSGNVYVAEMYNSKIRKITPSGIVSTLAGTGYSGSNDGPGTSATFNSPTDVAVDSFGNVYVADESNNNIRKITPSGVVSTIANGKYYTVDLTPPEVTFTYSPTNQITSNFISVSATVTDNVGFYPSSFDSLITDYYFVDLEGVTYPSPATSVLSTNKNLLTSTNSLYSGYLSAATYEFEISASGTLYLTLKDIAGNITTCADGGYITEPTIIFGTPSPSKSTPIGTNIVVPISALGTFTDNRDNYYSKLLSANNDEVELFWGDVTSAAQNVNTFNVTLSGNDNLFGSVVVSGGFLQIYIVSTFAGTGSLGSNDGAVASATFNRPRGVDFDSLGNMYVADTNSTKIRKITPSGVVSTFAGTGSLGAADGPGTSATFFNPFDVVVDSSNNLYIADAGNRKIRKITPSGVVSTFAGTGSHGSNDGAGTTATFNYPDGITIDSSNNIYVTDSFNNKIRKITPSGVVSTIAGTGATGSIDGPATSATFNRPNGITLDSSNNIYVTDSFNNKIRKITPAGDVSTFAGSGTQGDANGTGTAAEFNSPDGLAIDSSNNIYVADYDNHKIRKITPSGVVSTFAGTGASTSIDGEASVATFDNPHGIHIDSLDNIYVVGASNKIRKIVIDS